ncbi:MAG TPA: aminotransferase class V-fold PLP-dependent enzyme [Casimicrobiaceae bacterium]|nr:aminotransferase class V-fold PLP-dependent enzyme [Casimicrobiaceae bacterium]
MNAITDALALARAQFPITTRRIYFDLANMNSPPACVTDALARYFAALQDRGGDKVAWAEVTAATRRKAAALLGCDAGELAFCRNTSDGLNIAANAIDWHAGDNVVLSADEHPNNVFPWLNLRRRGVEVRLVPGIAEWVDAAALAPYVDARTRVVAVADVSFLPGQRNDLDGIANLCRERGALLVVDGVQAAGLMDVRLRERGIAMWAASAHKGLLAPHGTGLFYCRHDLIPSMMPAYLARNGVVPGAADDHFVEKPDAVLRNDACRFEIGNLNYSGIHALSAALDLLLGIGIRIIERHVLDVGDYMTEKLAQRGIRRLGPPGRERRSSICAFAFPGEGWAEYLGEQDIVVSGRRGAIRVSLGCYNTFDEVDQFIAVVDRRLNR